MCTRSPTNAGNLTRHHRGCSGGGIPFDDETLGGHVSYPAVIEPTRYLKGEGFAICYNPTLPQLPSILTRTGVARLFLSRFSTCTIPFPAALCIPYNVMLNVPAQGHLFRTLDAEILASRLRKDGERYPTRKDVVAERFDVGSPPREVETTERIRGSLSTLLGGGVGTKRVTRSDGSDECEEKRVITPESHSLRPKPPSTPPFRFSLSRFNFRPPSLNVRLDSSLRPNPRSGSPPTLHRTEIQGRDLHIERPIPQKRNQFHHSLS